MNSLPGFLPGVGASVVVGALSSGRVARTLGGPRALSFALVLFAGIIASATLTPYTGGALGAEHPGTCDLSRMDLAPLRDLLRPGDVSGNVLLFVPLGVCLALLPRSRSKAILIAAAVASPFVIEGTQLLLPALHRACESADIVDNLTGLVAGLAAGGMVASSVRVWPRQESRAAKPLVHHDWDGTRQSRR